MRAHTKTFALLPLVLLLMPLFTVLQYSVNVKACAKDYIFYVIM